MSKLKTLKDISEDYFGNDSGCDLEDNIRAEAIKWVKWINKEDGGMCHTCDELWNRFFNITEEELK